MSAEQEREWTTERWVYTGRTMNRDKLAHTFALEAIPDGTRRVFAVKRGQTYVVGGIYEVETSEGSARLAAATYAGTLDQAELVARWAAEDRTAQVEAQAAGAERAAAREAGEALGAMTLAQARAFIHSGPYAAQGARTAVILKALGL